MVIFVEPNPRLVSNVCQEFIFFKKIRHWIIVLRPNHISQNTTSYEHNLSITHEEGRDHVPFTQHKPRILSNRNSDKSSFQGKVIEGTSTSSSMWAIWFLIYLLSNSRADFRLWACSDSTLREIDEIRPGPSITDKSFSAISSRRNFFSEYQNIDSKLYCLNNSCQVQKCFLKNSFWSNCWISIYFREKY